MSATIIILPVVRTETDAEARTTIAVPLPPRVLKRLEKIAAGWNVPESSAAEILLTQAVNAAVGVKR